jgi:O-antigen/teichoic acid export membrane protein
MFSSAVTMQALLSATSLIVGLILIRLTSDQQYGYYILVLNSLALLTGLQNAYIQPPMVMRMISATTAERADLIGGLYLGQRRVMSRAALAAATAIAIAWVAHLISPPLALLLIAAVTAALATSYREFFRMVLLAYRLPNAVLKADAIYVVVLMLGAAAATLTPAPAAAAAATLGLAALAGGQALSKALWRHEPWNPHAAPGMLREMAPLGSWSTAGCGAHWAFSQGYNYVVAGALDVTAVAALAATRLLMMPINLLSSGIGSLMLPTASGWLHAHGAAVVFRRLLMIATALATLALCYCGVLWLVRDWIFTRVMHKQFAHADLLIALWSCVFLVMVFRDQLLYLPGACGLFRSLTLTTGTSAVISLGIGYVAIRQVGLIGAPLAVLAGELVNVLCIVYLSLRQIRLPARIPA